MNTHTSARSVSSGAFARRMLTLKPSAIREILKTTEAPDVISFAGGLPAPELFPTETIAHAAQGILQTDGPAALQYGVTEGFAPLRQSVAAHLHRTVGLDAREQCILITHGSQQALDLLGKVLLDPGDTVLVENPSYLGALQAFQAYEAEPLGLPCDEEGLRADALADILKRAVPNRPKFLYLVTNFQNPTGRTLSARRRVEIAAIAADHQLLVVEDDPYGELRFHGKATPALCAQCDAPWVHLGTASKLLAPGLRVAWLTTSDDRLYSRLVTAKQASDLHTATFNQRIVHRLLSDPAWLNEHLKKLRTVYGRRCAVMAAAIRSSWGDAHACTVPEGGMFLWVTLRRKIDTVALLRSATSRGVAFVPGAPFWIASPVNNTLRLNFSNASEARIEEGIARLGELIRSEGSRGVHPTTRGQESE